MTVVSALLLRWNRTTTNDFVFRADGASRQTVAVVHGPRFERPLQATPPKRLSLSLSESQLTPKISKVSASANATP